MLLHLLAMPALTPATDCSCQCAWDAYFTARCMSPAGFPWGGALLAAYLPSRQHFSGALALVIAGALAATKRPFEFSCTGESIHGLEWAVILACPQRMGPSPSMQLLCACRTLAKMVGDKAAPGLVTFTFIGIW